MTYQIEFIDFISTSVFVVYALTQFAARTTYYLERFQFLQKVGINTSEVIFPTSD
jgi:hypothetical protein